MHRARPSFPADPRADERAGPGAARDRRADDRPSRAGVRTRSAHDVLAGDARVFQTAGRSSSTRLRAPARGRRRWSTRCRPATACSTFETGHFATLWRAMATQARAARSSSCRATGATASTRPRSSDAAGRRPRAIKAVLVVHNETSTGVTRRIAEIRAAIDGPATGAAAGRHDLLARLDRLPPRRVGRRRHRRRLAEGADAARRARLQRGLDEGAGRARRPRSCRAPTGTGRRCSRPTQTGLLPLHAARPTCCTGCARRWRCCARRGWRTSSPATRATPRRRARGRGLGARGAVRRSARAFALADRGGGARRRRRRRGARLILERFDMSLGRGLGKLQGRMFRIGHLGDFNDLMLAGHAVRGRDGAAARGRADRPAAGGARRAGADASWHERARRRPRPRA